MDAIGNEDKAQTRQKLQVALERGLGSAFRFASEIDSDQVVEMILRTSRRKEVSARPQETPPAAWWVALADHVGGQTLLCDQALAEIDQSEDREVIDRSLNLIFHFARRGSEPARDALYRTFVRQQFDDASIGGNQIIDLDRFDGFLFATEVIGQRLVREMEYESTGALFKHAAARLDRGQLEKRLARRAQRSAEVDLYRERLIELGLISDESTMPMVPLELRASRAEARALTDRAEGASVICGARVLAERGLDVDAPSVLAKDLPQLFDLSDGNQLATALVDVTRDSPFPEFAPALQWAANATSSGSVRREAIKRLIAWNEAPRQLISDGLRDAHADVRSFARDHLVPAPGLKDQQIYCRTDDRGGRFFHFSRYRLDPGVAALWCQAECLENVLAAENTQTQPDRPSGPFDGGTETIEAVEFAPRMMIQMRVHLGDLIEEPSLPTVKVKDAVEILEAAAGFSSQAVAYRLVRPMPVLETANYVCFQDFLVLDPKGGRVGRFRFGARYLD
ncbi:MAG: hypothetical protein V3W41_06205 [Planctomycetota bacterium]